MSDSEDELVKRLLEQRTMRPTFLRRMWARTTLIKQLLIKLGFITKEEWEVQEKGMVNDIENKLREQIRAEYDLDRPPEESEE